MSVEEIQKKVYPKVAKYNPISEMVIVLDKINSSTIEELFKLGYHDYKLLNTLILVGTRTNFKSFLMCVYDPFYGDVDYREPLVYCENADRNNSKIVMKKIKDFVEMRLRNMHKYPLKVRC